MAAPMPAPRARRSGPLWSHWGTHRANRRGNSLRPKGTARDAQVGRFPGFQFSRPPPTQHERGDIA